MPKDADKGGAAINEIYKIASELSAGGGATFLTEATKGLNPPTGFSDRGRKFTGTHRVDSVGGDIILTLNLADPDNPAGSQVSYNLTNPNKKQDWYRLAGDYQRLTGRSATFIKDVLTELKKPLNSQHNNQVKVVSQPRL